MKVYDSGWVLLFHIFIHILVESVFAINIYFFGMSLNNVARISGPTILLANYFGSKMKLNLN